MNKLYSSKIYNFIIMKRDALIIWQYARFIKWIRWEWVKFTVPRRIYFLGLKIRFMPRQSRLIIQNNKFYIYVNYHPKGRAFRFELHKEHGF